ALDRIVRGAGAARPARGHPRLHLVDLSSHPPISEPDRACRRLCRDAAAADVARHLCAVAALEPGCAIFDRDRQGVSPRTIDLGRWRYLTATIFILYFVVIVLLPFLVLAWSSLQKFYSAPSWAALSRVSLDSYRAVLEYPQFANTVWNSLVLAVGSATT